MSYAEEYKDCLDYIDSFWDKVTVRPKNRDRLFNKSQRKTHQNILHVPNSFIVPNDKKFSHVFYWDTFFMMKGLIATKREWLLKSMVENFIYLYEKHGVVPNFNSPASTGRSQPPFLTSMILDTYNGYYFKYLKLNPFKRVFFDIETHNSWLERAVKIAEREYFHVWIDSSSYFHHSAEGFSLSKYGDRDIGYAHSAELESGWDFTSRFYNRCNEFLPIDLNVFLYKYEIDFAKIYMLLGDGQKEALWKERAEKKKK